MNFRKRNIKYKMFTAEEKQKYIEEVHLLFK